MIKHNLFQASVRSPYETNFFSFCFFFCFQPWIMNDTIRENVLFGLSYDKQK